MSAIFTFQVHPSYHAPTRPKIDRGNSRMFGVVAAMDVEATGHGICFDVQSLEAVAALGNANPDGVPGRFGHPGMSENATGRKVHLARNWRVVAGAKADDPYRYLLHDVQFMPAARVSPSFSQDPIEYIMKMAETHPKHFGESMVLRGKTVWTTADGQEIPTLEIVKDEETGEEEVRRNKRPANALTEVPVLRPNQLHFVDWVNEGAVTHSGLYPLTTLGLDGVGSIFTQGNANNLFLSQLFTQMDEVRERFNVPLAGLRPKVERLLGIYINSRVVAEGDGVDVSDVEWEAWGIGDVVDPLLDTPLYFESEQVAGPSGLATTGKDSEMARKTRQQRTTARKLNAQVQADHVFDPAAAAADLATEMDQISDETDDTLDLSTQILRQAEALAANMSQHGAAMQDGPSLASSTQIDHLQQQVDQNADQVHELTQQLKKLGELLVRNMELTAILQRNISKASGETVITQRVPLTGLTGQLEGFTFQQPMPGGEWGTVVPLSTEDRQAKLPVGVDETSPEARAMRAQQRRAQQQR